MIKLLNRVIRKKTETVKQLESMSATIHDMIMVVVDDPNYRPAVKTIIRQLFSWGLFNPIKDWNRTVWQTYKKLSSDVHVLPDRTDIGRTILQKPKELFKSKKVDQKALSEYLDYLRMVVDIGIVVQLNVLSDNIKRYEEVKKQLRDILDSEDFKALKLRYSPVRINQLISK